MDKKFIEALSGLTVKLETFLSAIPDEVQCRVREVCLRADKPLVVSTFDGERFVDRSGKLKKDLASDLYIVKKSELDECVKRLTEYSVHSYKDKINMGFITINGGHRAGVVGSCVMANEKIISITDISSINLRIARQIKGVSRELVSTLYKDKVFSTLIIGSPASGKTTLLRDVAYSLSNGLLGYYVKISIIDERGEIAAVKDGIPQNDVGVLSDVLDGYKKGEGMTIAIRSMSPKVIVIDEIGSIEDAISIRQSLNAGVEVIATAHAGSFDELLRKHHIVDLINEGAFQNIVLLEGSDKPCVVKEIFNMKNTTQQLKNEAPLISFVKAREINKNT